MIPVIIFLIAFVPRVLSAKKTCMTWDELSYPLSGIIYLKNVVESNFSSATWSFNPRPPILMYLYGLFYAVYTSVKTVLTHGLKLSYDTLMKEGASISSKPSTLLIIRLPSILLGCFASVITYFFSLDLSGDVRIAVLSALILTFLPRFIAQTSVAGLDGGVTFFYLLTFWLFFRAVKFNSLLYLILSGISLGFTVGSKETGAIAPSVVVLSFIYSLLNNHLSYHKILNLLLFLLIATTVLYVSWPYLWRQFLTKLFSSLGTTASYPYANGFYRGTADLKCDFYLVNLIVTTPIFLLPLFIIGMSKMVAFPSDNGILLLWTIIPMGLLSLPIAEYRDGVRQILFILPALSILASFGLLGIVDYVMTVFPQFRLLDFVSISVVISLMIFECIIIHPYYLDYYNHLVGGMRGAADDYLVGWWGEGMREAISYIDQHAEKNSVVWIYGPRSTAFFHSKRVDLKKSIKDEPIFFMTVRRGFEYSIDDRFLRTLRKGDLTFLFPYYFPDKYDGLDLIQTASDKVRYILIYRRFIYPGQVDSGNYKLVTTLTENYEPIHTVKIKAVEFCWIYDINAIVRDSRVRNLER